MVEPAAAAVEEGDTAEVEPAAADIEKADTAPAGPQHDDTVKMPGVPAVLSGGRHQLPQLPEQQVLGPEPVQTPAKKRRIGSLALAATVLAALLIGALLFAASRDGGVTAPSVPTVTATATATVSKPTSEPSSKSTDTGGAGSRLFSWKIWPTLPGPSNPFESRVHIAVGQIRFCRCSAGKEASGCPSQYPRRPTSRASSPPLSSWGSRVVTGFACWTLTPV